MARISPNQLSLDFTSLRNDMLARVRMLTPVLQERMSQQLAETVVEVLVRVVLFGDSNGVSNAKCATLAAGFSDRRRVGERTFRRWAALAKETGLLKVQENSHDTGGALPNSWRVDWDLARQMVANRVPSPMQRSRAEDCEGVPSPPQKAADTGRSPGGQNVRPRADKMSAPMYLTPNSQTNSPHPRSALARSKPSSEWDGVGGELEKLGMTLWRRFVAEAEAIGVTPNEVADWLVEFRAAKLNGPGAFFFRLRNGAWPGGVKVETAAEIAAKREQIARNASKQQEAIECQRAAESASQAKQEAMEREFGPLVDQLSAKERRELCERAFAKNKFLLTRSQKLPSCGLVREQLMVFLAKEGSYAR